jgi:GntR family transcriptional regulator
VRSRTLELSPEIPAYLRIHAELRQRIQRGDYAPESPLPSQRRLSEEFGVTLMTLRQAIELLKREQLLLTRPGLGTYVAQQRLSYWIGPLRSLSQDMASQGLDVKTTVLTCEEVTPPPDVAEELNLDAGETTVLVERLRVVEGKPLVYQCSHLPAAIGRRLRSADLADHSLYELMARRLGVEIDHAFERLYPAVLAAPVARLLRRPPGDPALRSERLTLSVGGRPVLHDQAFMPGDRLVIAAERRRHDVFIRYELLDRDGQAPVRLRAARQTRRIT